MAVQMSSTQTLLGAMAVLSSSCLESKRGKGRTATTALRPGFDCESRTFGQRSALTRTRGHTFRERNIGCVVKCAVATEGKATITFNIGETSLSVPLSMEAATKLNEAIGKLLTTFKEKEKATRPQRWESLDFVSKGDLTEGEVVFEAFCNPNAYSNAFQAKVLITAKDDRMKFMSEGPLSAIKADLDQYLGQK